MLRLVPPLTTHVSEDRIAFIIRMTRIAELETIVFLRSVLMLLGIAHVVSSSPNLVTLMMKAICPPKRRFLQEQHVLTSQKTAFYIVTAVKISNLRWY
jgi:hypothetical protein